MDWDAINIKLDIIDDKENNPDDIKCLGYTNQNSATPAIKLLGVDIDLKI